MPPWLPGFEFGFELGREWHDWPGLPFVYAFWAVRPGADLGPVEQALQESYRRGRRRVGAIAQREAPRLGLNAGFCRRYLETLIHLELGPRELAGVQRYLPLGSGTRVAPPAPCTLPSHARVRP